MVYDIYRSQFWNRYKIYQKFLGLFEVTLDGFLNLLIYIFMRIMIFSFLEDDWVNFKQEVLEFFNNLLGF